MKIAVCFAQEGVDCEDAVRRMTEAMRLCEHHTCRAFAVPGGAVGCVLTSDQHSAIPLLRKAPDGNLLAVSGVPIDMKGTLDERLDRVAAGGVDEAVAELKDLDGAFAALFWDARARKLVIVTDALGIQPLYMTRRDGLLLIATELKAFAASGLVDVEMDPAGWGAFVSLGFSIGHHTQLAGVRRADSGCIMIYDPASGAMESDVHWSWPEPRPEMTVEDVDTGEMLQIMRREIECYASHCRSGTVLLSGGFDSRLILALLNEMKIDCRALILAHARSSAEARFATRIARRLCCRDVERFAPSSEYYSSPTYLKYLVMDEVAIPSWGLHISTHVSAHIRPAMKAVWEGLGPGFAFAPAYPLSGGFAVYLQDRCKDRDSLHWQVALSVFSDGVGQAMYEGFKQLLGHEIGKYTDDDFGTARFQMCSQMRTFLALPPVAVYANAVLPFTPGLSRGLWNLAASIPLSVTSEKKLYLKMLKQHLPEALSVPVCSGGKLMGRRAFAPGLWLRARLDVSRCWCRYHWGRLPRLPVVGPTFGRLGLIPHAEHERNELLDAVVRNADPDHPDLDADTFRRLQQEEPPYSWTARLGRRMLFYWQAWRWIMEGRLTTWNAEAFLQEEMQRTPRGTGRET